MNQYTETEKTALQAADARKRYKAWMSKPFAGHDVRALREAAKGDADGTFTVPPSPVDPAEADAREALAKLASAWERGVHRAERVAVLRELGALHHLEGPEGNLERAKRRAEADTALGLMLVDALLRKRTVLLREQPFPLVRVARLPRPPRPTNVTAWQPLAAWFRARASRLGERYSP